MSWYQIVEKLKNEPKNLFCITLFVNNFDGEKLFQKSIKSVKRF